MPTTHVRAAHRSPALLVLVFLGGAAGTVARWAVGVLTPHLARVPLGTVVVNVVGAFLLGVLLETLGGRGPDEGRRRALRVTLGTGLLGGFTTYSALAQDTVTLLHDGHPALAAAYALVTVVLGLAASAGGVALARRGRIR